MNFRKNNGFTGIDISIAVIIILIFLPTLFGILYNNRTNKLAVNMEAKSLNIAVDILEGAKTLEYSDIDISNENFKNMLNEKKYIQGEEEGTYAYKNNYDITIEIEENSEETDIQNKNITVIVNYKIKNKTKTIEISTYIYKKIEGNIYVKI